MNLLELQVLAVVSRIPDGTAAPFSEFQGDPHAAYGAVADDAAGRDPGPAADGDSAEPPA